jgi:hypothetical protein
MLVERFHGGRRLMLGAGAVGVLGLAITAVGLFVDARQALFSYLVAFAYWVGIAVAGLILLAILHAARARWMVVLRRPVEWVVMSLPVMVLLALPVYLGVKELFVWSWPEETLAGLLGSEGLHHLHKKHAYLNIPFFAIRGLLYFALFLGVGELLLRWSFKQDEVGGHELLGKQRWLSPAALPFLALGMTFAGFDWLMTLTPLWQSTIFGVYYFAGSFLSAIAVVTLASLASRKDKDLHGAHMTLHHFHNLGKLLLAFTSFWAYIGFSQFMLVWVGNLPEETPYYVVRMQTPWASVSTFLVIGHFVLPFVVLLSRTAKLKLPLLGAAAGWILLVHFVDLHWLVMPALHDAGPNFSVFDLTAWLGVGGVAVAFAVFRLRGRFAVPVQDPYLPDSLRYVQP